MGHPSRKGSFSPSLQQLHTGPLAGAPSASAGPSPSTSSPVGANSSKSLVVAQILFLLSTIKDDGPNSCKALASLRKLLDEHGMDVFPKYFTRLVAVNAAILFPGRQHGSRSAPIQSSNLNLLVEEMQKLSRDFCQARRIADAIESGSEEVFQDFDLSSFMEYFKLDALEKTTLALAFKLGSRADLKTKADAILTTNFPTLVNILSRSTGDHADLAPDFIAELLDRFIQIPPPNFNAAAKKELEHKVEARYAQSQDSTPTPAQVLAALDLMRLLADKPPNALALYIHRVGSVFTSDEDTCLRLLQSRPSNIQPSEEQVAVALTYTTISLTPQHNPSIFVGALRRILPEGFRWQDVVSYFDHPGRRVTSNHFLRLYRALLPIAQEDGPNFNIQRLWGGEWENPETQLSFICAYASLKPDELDATTIPGLKPTFTIEDYAQARPSIQESAAYAVRHPLVSEAALTAVFNVALHSMHASQSTEAKRLFQDVVVPNLAIFVASAFGVPKPWPQMAEDTLVTLFPGFLPNLQEAEFVMHSLWMRDKDWVKQRLIDEHAKSPMLLPFIFQHVIRHNWLDELVYMPNGFGLDLASYAHAEGALNLQEWGRRMGDMAQDFANVVVKFLLVKAAYEISYQRPQDGQVPNKGSTTLQVRTVWALLQILGDWALKLSYDLIPVQRQCITAYPRLINYGEGFDEIIDTNGREGNALPTAANSKMEEHYKKMYSDEIQVRTIVDILERYKHSRDPLEQDVFACMIHGLFDEYAHYVDYPLEALATTAVLFGGIISHRLIAEVPLETGLGMILEAVRDHRPDEPMYKFGLQALMQLFSRLREWPGFCQRLLAVPGLMGTEAWKKAEEVAHSLDEEPAHSHNGAGPLPHPPGMGPSHGTTTNGNTDGSPTSEQIPPPFSAINVDPPPYGPAYEDPSADAQGKIQFVLNNLTDTTLHAMFKELREMLEGKHQQWFANHLVEERAKMQPNYHHVYLDLVKQFEDKALWAQVQRETYVSVQRMLNSEATMQNTTERAHLKNLGGWLGLLTLARDKPIKDRNIAFKKLLVEAHETKRLIVAVPFVCKVLIQGASSSVFRPPNPWLMDIIHLLIALYHHAEMKLNLKFEIEVLCKGLSLDHKSIEPSMDILNRAIPEEVEIHAPDYQEAYDGVALNGISTVNNSLAPDDLSLTIPDLGPSLTIPQTEVVAQARLLDMVRGALTRALQDIIQPVVDRSVTIAAISTREMIHKDFATEPDGNRMRNAAISMVKRTAGQLALVTSKEPLRANFTNYLRSLSSDLPQGLPEGIIIMCVNANLDLGSNVIQRAAEERAVPEIEAMIEPDVEARRRHRLQRPSSEPFVDPSLSRWGMTIPHPYKLGPGPGGLNVEQMAIYDDFSRQPRVPTTSTTPPHTGSATDARSIANEILQDPYGAVPNLTTPGEAPSMPPHLGTQIQQHYPQAHSAIPNGRQGSGATSQMDARAFAEKITKYLEQLSTVAMNSHEQHFSQLPRPHDVLNVIDALVQLIIKTQSSGDQYPLFAAHQISNLLFRHPDSVLLVECLVHVLEAIRKVAGAETSAQIRGLFHQQPGSLFLNLPLIEAVLKTGADLIDWRSIDVAMAALLRDHKDGSLEFFEQLMDLTLLNGGNLALFTDFVKSLEEAWCLIAEQANTPAAQRFKVKVLAPTSDLPASLTPEELNAIKADQMDYVFDEWVNLCGNLSATDKAVMIFVQQMQSRGVVTSKEDFLLFVRQALDKCVDRYEQSQIVVPGAEATPDFQPVDALVKMINVLTRSYHETGEGRSARALFLDSMFGLGILVLNHHFVKRGGALAQKPFFRYFSCLLYLVGDVLDDQPQADADQLALRTARRLKDLGPTIFPGFLHQWMALIGHRAFVPAIQRVANNAGWAPYTSLLVQLLLYLGELLKPTDITAMAKSAYQGTLKLLFGLNHDYPGYLDVAYMPLCQAIPPHTTQLLNVILAATPATRPSPDPMTPGLKIDRMEIPEQEPIPAALYDPAALLRRIGLLDIVDQTLQAGPSEDTVAQISHAIRQVDERTYGLARQRKQPATTFCFVPVAVNRDVIDALVVYIGSFAVARAGKAGEDAAAAGSSSSSSGGTGGMLSTGVIFSSASSDAKTLRMLATELGPEARYYLLSSMANQLRHASSGLTHYFLQAALDLFAHEPHDPEQTEVRQQMVRVLLERLIGCWPQPWGLLAMVMELVKNDAKYGLFDAPFIKAQPEVRRLFEEKLLKASAAS